MNPNPVDAVFSASQRPRCTRVDDGYLIETFQRVAAVKPDIVVMTGDFVSYHAEVFHQLAMVWRCLAITITVQTDRTPGWRNRSWIPYGRLESPCCATKRAT
jgi:hypothetical protein